jgi:4-hydroxy-tetrahydrodipicolinate reductase
MTQDSQPTTHHSQPTTPIRIVVSGSGKMGLAILEAVEDADGIEPVGVIEKFAGSSSLTLGSGSTLPMSPDPGAMLADVRPDVVVDFTNAAWTPVVADAALHNGVRPVIGTSGLSEQFVASLAERCHAQRLGGIVAANFAIGAVLLMQMAKTAARFFDSAEIIELHHDQKVDAPSGTAIATARGMAAARGRPFERNVPQTETLAGARTAEIAGVSLHSVRLRGLVAHQEVIFGGQGQTLTIRHDTTGRESFMPGIILAVREVVLRQELVVGLEGLIGLA